MKSEVMLNKIVRDLKQFDLISKTITGEVREGEVKFHLNLFAQALLEGAWKEHSQNNNCQKPVIQFKKTGKRIARYESVAEAANKLKCDRTTLYRAIKKGTPTRKGHLWVYE